MNKIYRKLKKVYLRAIEVTHELRYKKDFAYYCNCQMLSKEDIDLNYENRLFLVPHADDDLLGGYRLSQMSRGNFIFGYFGLTGSNNDVMNKKTRDIEFESFCKEVDVQFINIKSIKELAAIITDRDIKSVYLTSIIDWHPEHRRLNYDLLDSLCQLGKEEIDIYWYSITVPICHLDAEIVPMSKDDQDSKYNLFSKVYRSQGYMSIQRFIYQERINAMTTGAYAAEVFLHLDKVKWEQIIECIRKMEPDKGIVNEFNSLKKEINSIKKIRELSGEYYSRLLQNEGNIVI